MTPTKRVAARTAAPTKGNGAGPAKKFPFAPPYWGVDPACPPDLTDIQIEDGKPVDSIFTEKQSRLLAEPLFTSWKGGERHRNFVAMTDVGLFFAPKEPPLVPDFLLSMDITQPSDMTQKANLSYFLWLRGKLPEVATEIVSNLEGGEDTDKLLAYARIGVPNYVIHDPWDLLKGGVLRVYRLSRRKYKLQPSAPVMWIEDVGLGLTLWHGVYEGAEDTWLRWCDKDGNLVPTGAELAEQAKRRAEQERQRAQQAGQEIKRLKELLRQAGVELPEEVSPGDAKKKRKQK